MHHQRTKQLPAIFCVLSDLKGNWFETKDFIRLGALQEAHKAAKISRWYLVYSHGKKNLNNYQIDSQKGGLGINSALD